MTALTCAIQQTGLLSNWLLSPTTTHVIRANPSARFHYVGLFQVNGAKRWHTNHLRVSSIGEVSLDEGRAMLGQCPNAEVEFLDAIRLEPRDIPASYAGRKSNFQNDFNQLWLIAEASKKVPRTAAWVLRIREDAGWYAPFSLARLVVPGARAFFQDCMHWHGLNDKVWMGRRDTVIDLQARYFEVFLTERCANTEDALARAARNVSRTIRFPVSDARMRRQDRSICWSRFYLCKGVNVPRC